MKNKSFDFAIRIVKLYQYLRNDKKEFVLSKQLLRLGTGILKTSKNQPVTKEVSSIN